MDWDTCSEVGGWEGVAGGEQQHGLAEHSEVEHPIVQNQNSFHFQ